MLTTLLYILTNKNESKQHTECIQQFYIAHKFPWINISSTVQWSIILQPCRSKIRHYLEHFVKLFHIKMMVHLQMGFQSLDKFYPSAPKTHLSLQLFSWSSPIQKYFSSSLLFTKWDRDEREPSRFPYHGIFKEEEKKYSHYFTSPIKLFFFSFSLNTTIPNPLVCFKSCREKLGLHKHGLYNSITKIWRKLVSSDSISEVSPWTLPDLIRKHSASLWQLLKKIIMTWPLSSFRWKSSRKWQETEVRQELIKEPLAREERNADSRRRYNFLNWKTRNE